MNKVCLIILDGWGMSPRTDGNAIYSAKTPTFNSLLLSSPTVLLQASGEAVGLPDGEMGNSEVGHLSIGSGRVVAQDYTQINESIQSREFFKKKELLAVCEHTIKNNSVLHLVGILTDSGVHGSIKHLEALIELANLKQVPRIMLHLFTDGRDSPPQSAETLLKKIEPNLKNARLATLVGRFFAMDRDKNWERIEVAYRLITELKGTKYQSYQDALRANYHNQKNDENLEPCVFEGALPISSNDGLIIFNFRADRATQIAETLLLTDFPEFQRNKLTNIKPVIFTNYNNDLEAGVAFSVIDLHNKATNPLTNPLGKILSSQNLTQLHAAESEKFAHVTYFFNSSKPNPFAGEERIIVPSPKLESFAQKPAMSAIELTQKFLKKMSEKKFDFAVLNFANADMLGHTGNLKASIQGVEIVDNCVKEIIDELGKGYQIFITADHGNAEEMLTIENKIDKEHSVNPVPFIKVENFNFDPNASPEIKTQKATEEPIGILADIAPTILSELGIKPTTEITGEIVV